MKPLFDPIFLNRSLLAWLNLLIGIIDIIVAINITSMFGKISLAFIAGFCFCTWVYDTNFQSLKQLIEESLSLNKKPLNKLESKRSVK